MRWSRRMVLMFVWSGASGQGILGRVRRATSGGHVCYQPPTLIVDDHARDAGQQRHPPALGDA
jgi:hypothetical protein